MRRKKCHALIDTRTKVSTISQDLCPSHVYDILSMTQMLKLEQTGGFSKPYLGYVEACIRIPQIKEYDRCVLLPVLKVAPYSNWVPIQIGTTIIERAMQKITSEELNKADSTW